MFYNSHFPIHSALQFLKLLFPFYKMIITCTFYKIKPAYYIFQIYMVQHYFPNFNIFGSLIG